MRTKGSPFSVICGIAVRYGEDVIILDGCKGKFDIDFPNKQPLNPSMKLIKKSATAYQVGIIICSLAVRFFSIIFVPNFMFILPSYLA